MKYLDLELLMRKMVHSESSELMGLSRLQGLPYVRPQKKDGLSSVRSFT